MSKSRIVRKILFFLILIAAFSYGLQALAAAYYLPTPSMTSTDDIVEHVLKSTLLSATTTQLSIGESLESATGTPIQSVESSTTTLSIDAPMVKLWQGIGGLTSSLSGGSKGKEVLAIQGALKAFIPEFKNTYVTGYFSQKTVEAIKSLQKKWGLEITGSAGPKTRAEINRRYLEDLCPVRETVDRSYEHVDRETALPMDYVPPELEQLKSPVRTAGIICLSHEPARRLGEMFRDAKKAGHDLIVISGYRRPEIQKLLQKWSSANNITASTTIAVDLAEAGHSEHQLGTTVDLSARSIGYEGPSEKLAKTAEGKWLAANSYKYGFVMSYPKGKESETGYVYEPWHFRYIGVDNAKDITDEGVTIKEYFQIINGTSSGVER